LEVRDEVLFLKSYYFCWIVQAIRLDRDINNKTDMEILFYKREALRLVEVRLVD